MARSNTRSNDGDTIAIPKSWPRHVRSAMLHVISLAQYAVVYLISDKGSQFWPCAGFKRWCKRRGIRPRFGAIGKHGSMAVIERLIGTIKRDGLRGITIPYGRDAMRQLLHSVVGWYNEHRPHTSRKGATPNELYFKRFPANRKPRIEPRPNWPRGSPCARPHALVGGQPGTLFDVEVDYHDGHLQLPIIRLRRAA